MSSRMPHKGELRIPDACATGGAENTDTACPCRHADKARQNLDLTVTEWTTAKLLLAALSCVDEVTSIWVGRNTQRCRGIFLFSPPSALSVDLNSDDDEPLLCHNRQSRLGNNVNCRFALDSTRSTVSMPWPQRLIPAFAT